MNNIWEILYQPLTVFKRLDELYEEDLDVNSNFIVIIFGAIIGLYSCLMEYGAIQSMATGVWFIVFIFFMTLISSGICLLLYNYVFTYLLYWFGKLLGSKGFVADTRTSIVYSIIPGLINLLLIGILTFVFDSIQLNPELQLWLLRIMSFIFWLWGMTILVKGFMILNKYGMVKAILNLLPIVAVGLLYLLMK
jgi:hypothetical protein